MRSNSGLIINGMSMRDAETGRLIWMKKDWPQKAGHIDEIHLPSSILSLRAVTRELSFSSANLLSKFRITQSFSLHGQVVEEWKFDFGFVIPGSVNTWENTIDAAEEEQMLPAHVLSGNLYITTQFYDGDTLIDTNVCRVFYD